MDDWEPPPASPPSETNTLRLLCHAAVAVLRWHAAVTVLFTDVSAGEAAKELVRRRYELSYNLHGEQRMRGDDAQVAALVGSLSVW